MARIIICDYLKTPLKNDDKTYVVKVDEQEFEVSEEGKRMLLTHLEGEEAPGAPQTVEVERIVYRDAPPETLQAATPGIDIEVPGDPFDPGPNSMPQPVRAGDGNAPPPPVATAADQYDDDDVPPIEIPPGHKRIKSTQAQRDKVVRDSKRFETGTLPALTAGARAQREADARLRATKNRDTDHLNRLGGNGIRLKDLNDE